MLAEAFAGPLLDSSGRCRVCRQYHIDWERPTNIGYCCRYRLPDEHYHSTYEELLACMGHATEKQANRALQTKAARLGTRGRYVRSKTSQEAVDKPQTVDEPEERYTGHGIVFKAGGSSSSTRRMRGRNRILKRDNHTCRYCGTPATTVDHIRSFVVYGSSSTRDDNLVAACRSCNAKAGGKFFDSFKEKKDWILKARGLA